MTVGLTGGIASGKTAVADRFAALGVPVLDTDLISREVVAAGSPGLEAIQSRFGNQVLLEDGSLDRAALRSLIFEDHAARKDLEDITHPLILAKLAEQSAEEDGPYQIHVIPLLVETGLQDKVNRVLLVDCPVEMQLTRLQSRDGLSASAARLIINSQADREARQAIADDILTNDARPDQLVVLVDRLHTYYQQLAKQGNRDAAGLRLP
ncbi:MAG: dephospho-CoA kinase [Gammaproteobacteria bacterium]